MIKHTPGKMVIVPHDDAPPTWERSHDWVQDIADMHDKYGFTEAHRALSPEKKKALLKFRLDFIQEELNEAFDSKTADDVVDALIDICVVAIGTLHAYEVDAHEAWDRVHVANMAKVPGIKASRPNPLGLPDLTKPTGWIAPIHVDNVGSLSEVFEG
jgi:Phosphoribosyl-ATP pyrophosphohydrolase